MGATAQQIPDLRDVRVEELTVDQLRQLLLEADRLKLSDDRLQELAIQQGMSYEAATGLLARLKAVRSAVSTNPSVAAAASPRNNRNNLNDSALQQERAPLDDFNSVFNSLVAKNWGAAVFTNRNLSFEPNLRLPTPRNYVLGADDELLIDVSGYSEATYQLKVSPEGSIRIPLVGPIQVSGLTIDQARRTIRQKLANTIYRQIRSGKTSVDINLGAIRSIKVSVIGEATLPGTFTLPSLATVYHALYACGGPSATGSFRDITVIRNNVTIATIDVYDYLATGARKNDVALKDQDVVKINVYAVRVELKGEVKRPGIYDVKPGESLADIIRYAGGFTDNAYTSRIQAYSNTDRDRQVTSVAENASGDVTPKRGDTYVIGRILNRFTNRVSISGAVYRPGVYELKPNSTLSSLLQEADGLREDAFTGRGVIHRYREDLSPEIVSFDVAKVLAGDAPDVRLRKEDRIVIYSRFDLREGRYVTVYGEVQNPGTFLFEEGMRLQDVVLLAGGFNEAATPKRIEVSRRLKQDDSTANDRNGATALIFQQDTDSGLTDSLATSRFLLAPFDEIVIRRSPGYAEQKNVVVEGEVLYAGKYTLQSKADKVSDLIKRSGGLTPFAYPKGAILVRTRNLTKAEQYNNAQGLNNLIKQNYQAGTPEVLLQNQIAQATQRPSENVGIELERIIDQPGSEVDLLLNDGDTLRIPRLLQTVRVNGEVLYPTLVRYDRDFTFKDYILKAGGFGERSARKRTYVVNSNGSARGTKSFLFIKNYPSVGPGSEIFVPVKREKERLRTFEIVSIATAVATLAAILFNVIRR